MTRILGPILGFHGIENGNWRVSALIVVDGSGGGGHPALQWSASEGAQQTVGVGATLMTHGTRSVLRYDFPITMTGAEQTIRYTFLDDAQNWTFQVPAEGASPNMSFASCNGFSNPRDKKKVPRHNAMWDRLVEAHDGKKYHLMLMGGDQVYADMIWENVTTLKDWSELNDTTRWKRSFTAAMETQVRRFYFDLYIKNWDQPSRRDMFASVPSIMMWDDHDIFDGWGSYPDEQQNCDVYQNIFRIARDHFRVFQLRQDNVALGSQYLRNDKVGNDFASFGQSYRIGRMGILVLDLRSERTPNQVMSDDTWTSVYGALDAFADEHCDHLMVVTSIPVVHPDFSQIEAFLNFIPGQQEVEDDLKDHWHSRTHKAERKRLIHRFIKFAEDNNTRVTLLSGDVHVAAMGVIESTRNRNAPNNAGVINQLTSSAIVHPAPPGAMAFTLEQMGKSTETVDWGITTRMLPLPGLRKRFIGARNWLSLEPDPEEKGRIWANWHVEGEDTPYTKAIHSVTT